MSQKRALAASAGMVGTEAETSDDMPKSKDPATVSKLGLQLNLDATWRLGALCEAPYRFSRQRTVASILRVVRQLYLHSSYTGGNGLVFSCEFSRIKTSRHYAGMSGLCDDLD